MKDFIKLVGFFTFLASLNFPLRASESNDNDQRLYLTPEPNSYSCVPSELYCSPQPCSKKKSLIKINPSTTSLAKFDILSFAQDCEIIAHELSKLTAPSDREMEREEEELDLLASSNAQDCYTNLLEAVAQLQSQLTEALENGALVPPPPFFLDLLYGDSEQGKRQAARRCQKPLTQDDITNGLLTLLRKAMTSITLAQKAKTSARAHPELACALKIFKALSNLQCNLFKIRPSTPFLEEGT